MNAEEALKVARRGLEAIESIPSVRQDKAGRIARWISETLSATAIIEPVAASIEPVAASIDSVAFYYAACTWAKTYGSADIPAYETFVKVIDAHCAAQVTQALARASKDLPPYKEDE